MIVSGGENVFPAEIEDLVSGHPEVVEATALGVEDKEWGHRLRCFVVKADGASIDEDAIKAYVRDNLARYKVPREVVFLDELPRNPTGKILKRELREMAADGRRRNSVAAGVVAQREHRSDRKDRPRHRLHPGHRFRHRRAGASGARVVVNGRTRDRVDEAVAKLGGDAIGVAADVATDDGTASCCGSCPTSTSW